LSIVLIGAEMWKIQKIEQIYHKSCENGAVKGWRLALEFVGV
jgi:hypothetical protein